MSDRERILLIALRQALITFLCALDDYLGMPRTVTNRRERHKYQPGAIDVRDG